MAREKTLTLPGFIRKAMLVAMFPVLLTGLSACSGTDGANGLNGKDGTNGTNGTNATTNESCMVCHTTGRIMDISDTTSKLTSTTGVAGVHYIDADNKDLAISNLTVTNTASAPVIAFNVKMAGANYKVLTSSQIRAYLADLVPANTTTAQGTFPSDYYERWAYERSTTSAPDGYTAWTSFDTTDATNGNYKITMSTTFGSALATTNAPEYSAAHHQKLVLRVSGKTETDAAYTNVITNSTVGILDFDVPALGATATTATLPQYQKAYVTVESCKNCHGAKMENASHASGYLDTRACVICHTPIGPVTGQEMQDWKAYLSVFIHSIHAAVPLEAWPTRIGGKGYGAVTYPQEINNCTVCHVANAAINAGGTAANIDAWKTHPTMAVCSSCHTTMKFDGSAFVGLNGTTNFGHAHSDDALCGTCHIPSGGSLLDSPQSITVAHDHTTASDYAPATDVNAPEFDVTITMTAPANGTHYVETEAPMVNVTLKNHATGADVDPAVYTTVGNASNAAGVVGGGLALADLYVYGPRAWAVPVLTSGSSTDPALATGAAPTQIHSLLSTIDSRVTRDASGFHYQLQAIPAGMTAGTYMVRFEGGDHGSVGVEDYVTSSVALVKFQIGTATESKKVAGDNCVSCHGATRRHLTQTGTGPHNAPFDTDHCNGCHDHSGNRPMVLNNHVHAVHSASVTGDLAAVNWGDVTFPSNKGKCNPCHTSGNTTYKTNVTEMPCYGCHADDTGAITGAIDHMRQNGGKL